MSLTIMRLISKHYFSFSCGFLLYAIPVFIHCYNESATFFYNILFPHKRMSSLPFLTSFAWYENSACPGCAAWLICCIWTITNFIWEDPFVWNSPSAKGSPRGRSGVALKPNFFYTFDVCKHLPGALGLNAGNATKLNRSFVIFRIKYILFLQIISGWYLGRLTNVAAAHLLCLS